MCSRPGDLGVRAGARSAPPIAGRSGDTRLALLDRDHHCVEHVLTGVPDDCATAPAIHVSAAAGYHDFEIDVLALPDRSRARILQRDALCACSDMPGFPSPLRVGRTIDVALATGGAHDRELVLLGAGAEVHVLACAYDWTD